MRHFLEIQRFEGVGGNFVDSMDATINSNGQFDQFQPIQ